MGFIPHGPSEYSESRQLVQTERAKKIRRPSAAPSKMRAEPWAPINFDATTSTVLAPGDRLQPVDSSDVRAMLPILHYTENLILNYDQNGDGVLDENELKAALPTFRGLIKQIGNGSADSEYWQDTIFWYLIAKGVAPTKSVGGKASLLAFIASEKFYTFKADRLKVLEIIASFNSTARQAKQDAVVDYVKSQGRNVRTALLAGSTSPVVTNLTQLFGCPDEKSFGELLHVRAGTLSDRDWGHRYIRYAREKTRSRMIRALT